MPHVPFCPCLEANLSPTWGILMLRTLIFTILLPLEFSETTMRSTVPLSSLREKRGASTDLDGDIEVRLMD
jgi:hypothetical protein